MSNKNKVYRVINKRNGEVLAGKVLMADSFWSRLRGLLGRESIGEDEGLILYPCSEIHCFGMKFNIDVIFLDREKRIISYIDDMQPGYRARVKEATYVIELQGGSLKKKQVRREDILVFEVI